MPVTLTDPVVGLQTGNGGTPTGYNLLGDGLKGTDNNIKGTSGNDKATLDTLYRDKDQVINMGDGDDLFVFGVNDQKSDPNGKHINGVVKMGDGGDDQVYLTHQLSDYQFTLRSDGGIKITYMGDGGDKGASVTFYGADHFTFRNIDDHTGTDYQNITYSHDQLYSMIQAASV